MVILLTITLSTILILLSLFKIYNQGISRIFNSPIVLSSLFFFLIHLLMPALQWDVTYFRYQASYAEDIYLYSMLYVMLLHIIFITGLSYFPVEKGVSLSQFNLNRKFLRIALIVTTFVFFIGAYNSGKNIIAIISMGYDKYITDRIALGVGKGLSLLLAHWTYIACLLFFFIYVQAKNNYKWIRRISLVLFLSSLAIAGTYYAINSNRNSLFLLIISLLCFGLSFSNKYTGHLTVRQLKKTLSLLFVVCLIVVIMHTIGKIRHQSGSSSIKSDTDYGLVNSLNGAFGNHENIAWLLEHEQQLTLGKTYVAGFANFVPRTIWPSKPVGAGPILKNMIYPGSYVVGRKGNSSLTTGLYTELLMNFGVFGSLLGSFLIALCLGVLFTKLGSFSSPILKLVYLFSIVMFSAQFMYAEFLGFFARYILSIVPFILVYLATRHIKSD
ncbi:oligosaccharide repeat unit polymerase [Thalassotalea fusca]